jgi:hypothetical protein
MYPRRFLVNLATAPAWDLVLTIRAVVAPV